MSVSELRQVETATLKHVSRIIAIADDCCLDGMSPESAERLGFLVSRFREQDYRDLVSYADHFYVLTEQAAVGGFLLAYSSDRIGDHEGLDLQIKARHPEPFVLVKQICIDPSRAGQGLGSFVYQHLFRRVPDRPLFAAIVLNPPNHRSVRFHEKLGFERVFESTPPDGMPRGVWRRSPAE